MTLTRILTGTALLVGLAAIPAFAGPALTVYNSSPAWQSIDSGGFPTFVLPATIPGCGSENTTTCEPTGDFFFNTTWTGIPSVVLMYDADGTTLSDIVAFDSTGPGGAARIRFFSDPSLNFDYSGYATYASYTESDTTGYITDPISICCELNGLSVVIASDGEVSFQPLGATFDVSDAIQFQGATNGSTVTPEPGTAGFMLLAGVVGLGWRRLRRA